MKAIPKHPSLSDAKQLNCDTQFLELLEQLPDTPAWLKDTAGRFLWVNTAFINSVGFPWKSIQGKRDSDLFDTELAMGYMADDDAIVKNETSLLKKTELVWDENGTVSWKITSKIPLKDTLGEVVATAGFALPVPEESAVPSPYREIAEMLNYIRTNLENHITVKDLVKRMHVSAATLERICYRHLKLTPIQLLSNIRMSEAKRLLKNPWVSVQDVATKTGYTSSAIFSRAFSREVGISPREYRKTLKQNNTIH